MAHLKEISKFTLTLLFSLVTLHSCFAQLTVTYTKSSYIGNYNIRCHGGNDGSINLTVSGGYSPYTFHWSNNATTEDISNLIAGTYSVIVTDDSSNTDTIANIVLVQPNAQSIDFTSTNASCHGVSDGRIAAHINGGTPSHSYLWNNTQTVSEIMNLAPGNYSLTVTDANNCVVNDNTTITAPTAISLSLSSPVNQNGFNVSAGIEDGSIDLTVTGGTPDYQFLWSSGQFTEDISELKEGTYYVQVKDDHYCTAIDSITLSSEDSLAQGMIAITTRGNWLNPNEDFIGTRNTAALRLSTHNLERMRIDENGNVGIGITNPVERLDVNGNVKIYGTLNVNNIPSYHYSNSSGLLQILMVNSEGNIVGLPNQFNEETDPCFSENKTPALWNTYSEEVSQSSLPQDATGDMVFLCDPKLVGIGTAIPRSKLDVHGDILISGSRLHVDINGNTGIGTSVPLAKLHVVGDMRIESDMAMFGSSTTSFTSAYAAGHRGIYIHNGASTSNEFITCENNDGIKFKVYNDGTLYARHLKVTPGTIPDFVYEKGYKLLSIPELEKFILKNKHLPDFPSAEDFKNKDIDIGEIQLLQWQKLEEYSMYIIQLKKENDALKLRVERLEAK